MNHEDAALAILGQTPEIYDDAKRSDSATMLAAEATLAVGYATLALVEQQRVKPL